MQIPGENSLHRTTPVHIWEDKKLMMKGINKFCKELIELTIVLHFL